MPEVTKYSSVELRLELQHMTVWKGQHGLKFYYTEVVCKGHSKVISRLYKGQTRSKIQKKNILCLPTLFMRVIDDCSWIIEGQALFQKVFQVVLG